MTRLALVVALLLASVRVSVAATGRKPPSEPTVSPEIVVGGAIALVVVVIIIVIVLVKKRRAAARQEHLLELAQEADDFLAEEARQGLRPIRTHLILKDDEHAILEEESALMETRAYRVYGGGGTRIGRVYVGGGASESHQRLKLIDDGTLTLTTKRLIFDGTQENRSVQLSQILSVSPWLDAIEVSTQRRMKSQVYRVGNPFIWRALIEALAAGKFSTRVRNQET